MSTQSLAFPDERPIFVRGLSRSGGTLLVTLLDAHPQVAMSYELYPTLLEGDFSVSELSDFAARLSSARFSKAAKAQAPTKKMQTFVARAERGGVSHRKLGELLTSHLRTSDLSTNEDRLRLIALCCRDKMEREGEQYWGLKCNNAYPTYLAVWPSARFINIIRDGRDVLASQMNTGSFAHEPRELAKSWVNTHRRFRALRDAYPHQAVEIRYESLVTDLKPEIDRLCRHLELPFAPEMLRHSDSDLTLYKSHHLSMKQVRRPVNASKVGRWREDLSPETVDQFVEIAGDMLVELGYTV